MKFKNYSSEEKTTLDELIEENMCLLKDILISEFDEAIYENFTNKYKNML